MLKAGLLSAVVAVSLVESYKWLSPDPSDETLAVLTQISRQLVNNSKGLESVAVESSQPFKPTTFVVLVNIIWFCSIVLCFASSVSATLVQQSARRNLELTQERGTPHQRALFRTFISNGLRKFRMDQLLLLLPIFLHIAIGLYSLGFLIFIFTINRNMSFGALAYLLFFGFLYMGVTVLPTFYFDFPYSSPFSTIYWHMHHVSMFGIFWTIRGIVDIVDRLFRARALSALRPSTYRHLNRSESPGPARWREMLEERVSKHWQRISDGRQRSVELYATKGPQAVDTNALEWTLTTLGNNPNKEIEIDDFAAWVPEFLDTFASGASAFMSDKPPTFPSFGFRLHHLLKICILRTPDLPEEERKRRLRVCLKCLWHWVKVYNENSEPLPSYFPLPNLNMISRLQTEQDPTASLTGRCFGALVAKKLAVDVDVNLTHSSDVVRGAKLDYLSTILGPEYTSTKVGELLGQPGAIGLANIVSLTSGGMDALVTEKVPSEVLDIFRKTVDILIADFLASLNADFLTSMNAELRRDLLATFHETHSNARQLQAPVWLTDQLKWISKKLSELHGAQRADEGPSSNV